MMTKQVWKKKICFGAISRKKRCFIGFIDRFIGKVMKQIVREEKIKHSLISIFSTDNAHLLGSQGPQRASNSQSHPYKVVAYIPSSGKRDR